MHHLLTYLDAVRHFKKHGSTQDRPYTPLKEPLITSSPDLPWDFDWQIYKQNNPELHLSSRFEAIKHFREYGHRENRIYSQKTCPLSFSRECQASLDETQLSTPPILMSRSTPAPQSSTVPQTSVTLQSQVVPQAPMIPQTLVTFKSPTISQTSTIVPQSQAFSLHDSGSHAPTNSLRESSKTVFQQGVLSTPSTPKNFDWVAYRALNPDLYWLKSYGDAVQHYLIHGRQDHRQYCYPSNDEQSTPISQQRLVKMMDYDGVKYVPLSALNSGTEVQKVQLPSGFDWQAYKRHNPDLVGVNSYQEAVKHYQEYGRFENRRYKDEHNPNQHINSITNSRQKLIPQPCSEHKNTCIKPISRPTKPLSASLAKKSHVRNYHR